MFFYFSCADPSVSLRVNFEAERGIPLTRSQISSRHFAANGGNNNFVSVFVHIVRIVWRLICPKLASKVDT